MSAKISSQKIEKTHSDFFLFTKALILSLIFTFVAIILFALVIKFFSLNDGVIVPVNLVIKCLAVSIGTVVLTKNRTGGLKKGIIFALCYVTLAFVIFSFLASSFAINFGLLLDYVVCALFGAIIGIVRVNKK